MRALTAVLRRQVRLGVRTLRDWRLTVAWARSLARSFLTSFLVLAATFWLLPAVTATGGPWALVLLVVLAALVGMLLRPLLVALAVALGGVVALILGVCLQALVMYIALRLDPGVTVHGGVFSAAGVAWLAAALAALVNWLADAGSEDVFLGQVRRRMARSAFPAPETARDPGMLIIQLDGLAAPLLRWAVQTGNLPNLRRWLHGDPFQPTDRRWINPAKPRHPAGPASHRFATWHTGLPSTTPAGQAGLLYGDTSQVPGFRWYEKESGRLLVTNRPRDAAILEQRLATGHGLLADDGVSISNMFSGDAPLGLLNVSSATLPGRSVRGYASFMLNPYGLARTIVLSVGEMLKELQQARRQKRRNVYPRVSRFGSYVLLRAVSNILLRDLNVALIAEQMARGAKVIFCDFVDYDEVAHHAGPARPEAMQTLEGLDRVLGTLHRISGDAGRAYELVVLSDHGQSQGAPFQQRHGERLEAVVQRLSSGDSSAAATGEVESWGPVNTLLAGLAGGRGVTGAATRAYIRGRGRDDMTLGPASREERAVGARPEVVVVAAGNLAMVYITDEPRRFTLDEILTRYPDLVPGLASHPGIGVVVVRTVDHGPVAIGPAGSHRLADGVIDGVDPVLPYGPYAARDLLAHQQLANVGDLVLISAYDPVTEEVAAFEELVGCHGGLGGWQTEAVLVYPARFTLREKDLVGPDAVHRELVGWLVELGLRTGVNAADKSAADKSAADESAADGSAADGSTADRSAADGLGLGHGPALAAAAQPAGHLGEQQDQYDGGDDALPGLGEDRTAEQADRGVHR